MVVHTIVRQFWRSRFNKVRVSVVLIIGDNKVAIVDTLLKLRLVGKVNSEGSVQTRYSFLEKSQSFFCVFHSIRIVALLCMFEILLILFVCFFQSLLSTAGVSGDDSFQITSNSIEKRRLAATVLAGYKKMASLFV